MACCVCRCPAVIGTEYCSLCAGLLQCILCQGHFLPPDNVTFLCDECQPRRRTALNGQVLEVDLPTTDQDNCFRSYFESQASGMSRVVREGLRRFTTIKLFVLATVLFSRVLQDGSTQTTTAYFRTDPMVITGYDDLNIDQLAATMNARTDGFNTRASGWNTERILDVQMVISPYRPLHGSS